MGSINLFWGFSSPNDEKDFIHCSNARIIFSARLFDEFRRANAILLIKLLWQGDEVFLPSFTASILLHSGMFAMEAHNMEQWSFFCSIQRCTFKTAHCTLLQFPYSNADAFVQNVENVNTCELFFALNWVFVKIVLSTFKVFFSQEMLEDWLKQFFSLIVC